VYIENPNTGIIKGVCTWKIQTLELIKVYANGNPTYTGINKGVCKLNTTSHGSGINDGLFKW
jgi:hypothetical protein